MTADLPRRLVLLGSSEPVARWRRPLGTGHGAQDSTMRGTRADLWPHAPESGDQDTRVTPGQSKAGRSAVLQVGRRFQDPREPRGHLPGLYFSDTYGNPRINGAIPGCEPEGSTRPWARMVAFYAADP